MVGFLDVLLPGLCLLVGQVLAQVVVEGGQCQPMATVGDHVGPPSTVQVVRSLLHNFHSYAQGVAWGRGR